MKTDLHARAACHRQFELLHEVTCNIGDRWPEAGGPIKAYAKALLQFSDSLDAPLQELLTLALRASRARIALESFDEGGTEGTNEH